MHRDLKPENILLDSKNDDAIKLIDFGTAQKFNPNRPMTQTFGTAYYIAPEVLTSSYNEKCDVWSIGVIMYMLLTGKPPFDGIDDKEIIQKVKKGETPFNTPELKKKGKETLDLLKKMLQKDPEKRISADEALKHKFIQRVNFQRATDYDVKKALEQLLKFKSYHKLQQAALTYIVTHLL